MAKRKAKRKAKYIVAEDGLLCTASPGYTVSAQCGWDYAAEQPSEDKSPLLHAYDLVHGSRGDDYGHPYDDFSRTAQMWSAILGCRVAPADVALCMIAVKMSREVNRPKYDNAVDIAGYAETLHMVREYEREVESPPQPYEEDHPF